MGHRRCHFCVCRKPLEDRNCPSFDPLFRHFLPEMLSNDTADQFCSLGLLAQRMVW
jgi:hypothetical protein